MVFHLALLLAILVSSDDAVPSPGDLPFVVIVNRSNPVSSLTRGELSAIFMKRVRSWPSRAEIVPIDLFARNPLREAFSRSIHGKSVPYVMRYWQRLIFSGRGIPPREVASDREVVEIVGSSSGAIGYVSRETRLGDGVKVVSVTP